MVALATKSCMHMLIGYPFVMLFLVSGVSLSQVQEILNDVHRDDAKGKGFVEICSAVLTLV